MAAETARAETAGDPVARFGRVFGPLCTVWMLWWFGSYLRIDGLRPLAWVTAPIVLYWVGRLRKVSSGEAAGWFGASIGVGACGALVAYVGPILQKDERGTASSVAGYALIGVAGALFARGMGRWLAEHDARQDLATWWRRAELACGIAVVAVAAYLARTVVFVLDDRPSTNASHRLTGGIMAGVAAFLGVAAVLVIAAAASITKDSFRKHLGQSR